MYSFCRTFTFNSLSSYWAYKLGNTFMPYVLKEGKNWVSWESILRRTSVWNRMFTKLYNLFESQLLMWRLYEFKLSKYFDFDIKYAVKIMVVLVFGIIIGVDNTGDALISLFYLIYLYVLQQVRSFLCARKVSFWMQHISYITYSHRLIIIICSWWEK